MGSINRCCFVWKPVFKYEVRSFQSHFHRSVSHQPERCPAAASFIEPFFTLSCLSICFFALVKLLLLVAFQRSNAVSHNSALVCQIAILFFGFIFVKIVTHINLVQLRCFWKFFCTSVFCLNESFLSCSPIFLTHLQP